MWIMENVPCQPFYLNELFSQVFSLSLKMYLASEKNAADDFS